jgi:AraC-like DNA-binding protein
VLSEVPERRARLRRLLGCLGDTWCCESATDLATASHTAAVVVADTAGVDITTLGSALDTARAQMRVLLVVLVAASDPARLHTAIAAAPRIRSVEYVAAEWHDVMPLTKAAVRRADVRLCAHCVSDAVRGRVPRSLVPFIEYCTGRTGSRSCVPDVVERAGLKRRTLDSRLRRAHLPTAERILGWCRVLHAAWRLDRSAGSVERIALGMGLTSASALRNYYRRYAGVPPTEARDRGGFAFLLDRFLAEFRSTRRAGDHRDAAHG